MRLCIHAIFGCVSLSTHSSCLLHQCRSSYRIVTHIWWQWWCRSCRQHTYICNTFTYRYIDILYTQLIIVQKARPFDSQHIRLSVWGTSSSIQPCCECMLKGYCQTFCSLLFIVTKMVNNFHLYVSIRTSISYEPSVKIHCL